MTNTNIKPVKAAKSFRDFKTVTKANDPENTKPMNVVIPGVGDTGDKLYVRSRYCTEYREAELKCQRQLFSLIEAKDSELSDDMKKDIITRSLCALVAGWTFEEKPDIDNVFEFLTENPTVYDDLNKFAANDKNFF